VEDKCYFTFIFFLEAGAASSGPATETARLKLDYRMKKLFADLLESHDGGEFKKQLADESSGNMLERAEAWQSFTDKFNRVGS
jgi:hypothetical protein